MPEEGAEFEVWLNSLDGDTFTQLLESRRDTEFRTLALPKFETEWDGQFQDILSALGLDLALHLGGGGLLPPGDNPNGYYLSQVIHAAKIEVNEQGTEAAAATVVEANSGSGAPPEDRCHPDLRPALPLWDRGSANRRAPVFGNFRVNEHKKFLLRPS